VSTPPWWVAVAAGGALGTAARVGWLLLAPATGGGWPLTIFLENVLGAFLLGLALGLAGRNPRLRLLASPFVTTGALGSFTTFSSLAGGMLELPAARGAVYGGASLALGLLAAAAGWHAASGRRRDRGTRA
jgi:fluoride exporter